MNLLQAGKPEACLETLRQAEAILTGVTRLQSMDLMKQDKRVFSLTLNNFGCYYKR